MKMISKRMFAFEYFEISYPYPLPWAWDTIIDYITQGDVPLAQPLEYRSFDRLEKMRRI
jgi:hypothetical protein